MKIYVIKRMTFSHCVRLRTQTRYNHNYHRLLLQMAKVCVCVCLCCSEQMSERAKKKGNFAVVTHSFLCAKCPKMARFTCAFWRCRRCFCIFFTFFVNCLWREICLYAKSYLQRDMYFAHILNFNCTHTEKEYTTHGATRNSRMVGKS